MSSRVEAPQPRGPKRQPPGSVPPQAVPGAAVASSERAARATAHDGTSDGSGSAYDLGKLNRHWYRRCLDALGKTLSGSGTSPSIEQLQELCDEIVTSFLTAVTGQAPDSDRPQFPADRAYYIPFAGDRAGKFNFAKPYFQLLSAPEGSPDRADQSLWSFLPWTIGKVGLNGPGEKDHVDLRIEIDRVASLDAKQGTISFAELLKSQLGAVGDGVAKPDLNVSLKAGAGAGNQAALRLRKSLFLRGKSEDVALSGLAKDLRGDIETALVNIFDIYKAFPGNAAIELLLLNHFQVLRWLWLLGSTINPEEKDGTTLTQRADIHDELFDVLLKAYFLGGGIGQRRLDDRDDLIGGLRSWVSQREAPHVKEIFDSKRGAPFQEAVRKRLQTAGGLPGASKRKVSEITTHSPTFEEGCDLELNELRPHFVTFQDFFLAAQIEERLEGDLAASMPDDPRRAGAVKRSFVWVCADFAKLESSLPEQFGARVSRQSMNLNEADEKLSAIGIPYQRFFQALEGERLAQGAYENAISSYWRTRGDAARRERVFASFNRADGLAVLPPRDVLECKDSPRPQNIFLRVKICDSLNEPMIDGLFVFTTDHDEVEVKGKDSAVRREDVEDLLAFGKVFFFIVRDHLHGLDRARESADIGRLNQHLYDRRLAALDACMDQRLSTEEFQRDGVSDRENWAKFTYEVLNNFAYSLIEKPVDVRNETFPFDRLLVIPLPEERSREGDHISPYNLPLYLFQALYVECRDQKIVGKGTYSLLKPFQSPVEVLDEDAEDGKRFHARSFQEVSDADGRKRQLEEFLQKHYVGARDPREGSEEAGSGSASDEPASYVVKAALGTEWDFGTKWALWAFGTFWANTKSKRPLWSEFLCDLTESYQALLGSKSVSDQDRVWFFCRYGLLRAVIDFVTEEADDGQAFQNLKSDYDRELRLRFGGNEKLDLLTLASGKGMDPVDVLKQREMIPEDPGQMGFVDYLIQKQDRWVLEFLSTLTNLVRNTEKARSQGPGYETYYQDVLTRPVDGADSEGRHLRAADQIGERLPPYSAIENGQDAIATFLGILNLTVGTTELDRRRLRCVIVMMRDYDDTKTGRVQSESEARKRLEVDRGDLTLYTRTFFQNVHRFLITARERQQIRVLSTDITQIARSWYSSGIDQVVTSLQHRLQGLVEGSESQNLGRLRPEIVECAFESLLEVLIRKEQRRDGSRDIELESFPFDRILHVPLLFGPTNAARWCYSRVTFEAERQEGSIATDRDDPDLPDSVKLYDQIRRRGRHALLKGGKKVLAGGRPLHFGPGEFSGKLDEAAGAVRSLLRRLAEQPALLDRFIRRLNEANTLQTLALGGTIYHLLKEGESPVAGGGAGLDWMPGRKDVARELRDVLERGVRSLERDGKQATVLTEAHMERVSLEAVANGARRDMEEKALFRVFGDVRFIPVFHELFSAVEGPEYLYGLTSAQSKVFYVYYSIPAPDGFIERDEFDSRYRGLFCLLVDDARTDDKTQVRTDDKTEVAGGDDGVLSDAEAADLDDIRTFVHNAMSNLGLVLWQQALEHKILRPGVEQDLLGMMHRLKNELGSPVSALSGVKRILTAPEMKASPGRILERAPELILKIDDADKTIAGIQDLFRNMKRLSDFQHGQIPLQNFTSDWLAWTFLLRVCQACQKTAADETSEAAKEMKEVCARAKLRLETLESEATGGSLKRIELTDAVENVQRSLADLARTFTAEYTRLHPTSQTKIEFIFAFDVFTADKPLEFQGSYLLDEALNTLIENGFQALISYVEREALEQKPASVGRMRLVCRRSEERDDEVLIEVRNSSSELPQKLLDELNANPPRTVSAQIHSEVSGKRGGSGFGHYFARRIIAEYCGGRQARRKLDIDLTYGGGLARTQLRLLKPSAQGYRSIERTDLERAMASEFKDATILTEEESPNGDSANYRLPREIQLPGLLRTIRQLLSADVEAKIAALSSELRDGVCDEIRAGVDQFREMLATMLQEALPRYPEFRNSIDTLRDTSVCRLGSIQELSDVLEGWRTDDTDMFKRMVTVAREGQRNHSISSQLRRMLSGKGLSPVMLIPEKARESYASELRRFTPYLAEGSLREGLDAYVGSMDKLDIDADGSATPSRRTIVATFRRPRFAYQVTSTNVEMRLNIWVHLLQDGSALESNRSKPNAEPLSAKDLRASYPGRMLGRTVAQHQAAFRSGNEPIGDLRFFPYRGVSQGSTEIPSWKVEVVFSIATSDIESTPGGPM